MTRMIIWDTAGNCREFRGKAELLEFLKIGYTQLFHAVETGEPVRGWFVDEALTDGAGIPLLDALEDTEEQARKAFRRKTEAGRKRNGGDKAKHDAEAGVRVHEEEQGHNNP